MFLRQFILLEKWVVKWFKYFYCNMFWYIYYSDTNYFVLYLQYLIIDRPSLELVYIPSYHMVYNYFCIEVLAPKGLISPSMHPLKTYLLLQKALYWSQNTIPLTVALLNIIIILEYFLFFLCFRLMKLLTLMIWMNTLSYCMKIYLTRSGVLLWSCNLLEILITWKNYY